MFDTSMDRRLVILTSDDEVTREVRVALSPPFAVLFAETEAVLHRYVAEGARLVVLHVEGGSQGAHLPGRLIRAVPALRSPIVALADRNGGDFTALAHSSFVAGVICPRTERWAPLLRTWASHPLRAHHLVEELRVLHECAPPHLFPILEELALAEESALSVKRWSFARGLSRTRLHRSVAGSGVTPSQLVDAIRALHAIGPRLVSGGNVHPRKPEWVVARTQRRVLMRTLALSDVELEGAFSAEPELVRPLVVERLGWHLRQSRSRRHASSQSRRATLAE